MTDDEIEKRRREIEHELDATVADANLQAASTWRIWSIGALAVIFALLVTTSTAPASELVPLLATFAAASAAFHIATWLVLRWVARVYRRSPQ